MKPVTNVTFYYRSIDAADGSLICEHDGARYAFACQPPDFSPLRGLGGKEPTLYKNSIARRGEPGYFHTRYLNTTSRSSQSIIAAMVEVCRREGLVEKARAETILREEQRLAEAHAEYEVTLKHRAGPALYEALAEFYGVVHPLLKDDAICDHAVDICWCGYHAAAEKVETALAAARPKPETTELTEENPNAQA